MVNFTTPISAGLIAAISGIFGSPIFQANAFNYEQPLPVPWMEAYFQFDEKIKMAAKLIAIDECNFKSSLVSEEKRTFHKKGLYWFFRQNDMNPLVIEKYKSEPNSIPGFTFAAYYKAAQETTIFVPKHGQCPFGRGSHEVFEDASKKSFKFAMENEVWKKFGASSIDSLDPVNLQW